MNHYFDQTATKPCPEDVIAYYSAALRDFNFNPASRHAQGRNSREAMTAALKKIAVLLDCREQEIICCSGASEASNAAILGMVFDQRRHFQRILTTSAEHPATASCLDFVEKHLAFQVDRLPVELGQLDLALLEEALQKEQYDLVSLIAVNNENGALLDWQRASELIHHYQKKALIHLDVVQAVGKIPFSFRQSGADLASISCHKFAAPKGIGFLLCRQQLRLEALIHGGGQQNGRRSGTEHPAAVMAAAYALEQAMTHLSEQEQHCRELKRLLLESLAAAGLKFRSFSPETAVPHIVSLYFPDLKAETLQTALSASGFAVSIGSACSAKRDKVLGESSRKLGLSADESRHSIRVSLALDHSQEDVLELVGAIAQNLSLYQNSTSHA